MSITVSSIITRIGLLLADEDNVRWTQEELKQWIDDGVRQIVLARPDAHSVTSEYELVPGTSRQTIAGATRILRVSHNINSGEPIQEASRVMLDSEVPGWHKPVQPSQWSGVELYVFDNISPNTFYVYPCPPQAISGHKIEVVYLGVPATGGATIGLSDHYVNPIIDWVMYRAMTKDAEYAGNIERAAQHLNTFAAALQLTQQSEFIAASPAAATPTPAGAG